MIKRNLQKELEDIIKKEEALGHRPRLLLHACCGPCSSYCMEYLEKYFDLTVFFYNPNIDDNIEYRHRVEEAKRLIEEMNFENEVKFIEGDYDPNIFYSRIKGYENEKEGGKRCDICFELRLHEAAKAAADYGFDYFTTSLTISPMKNANKLCEIGEEVAKEYNVRYLPSDFKKKNGYKRSVDLSKEHNLYRQDYCGCSFSKRESIERAKGRDILFDD